MILFDRSYTEQRRKVILNGRVVTVIGLRGREVRIAEDGKWYLMKDFQPLPEEVIRAEHIDAVRTHVTGKSIATMKPDGKGVQFILSDNTRVCVEYDKSGMMAVSLLDSDGQKVL